MGWIAAIVALALSGATLAAQRRAVERALGAMEMVAPPLEARARWEGDWEFSPLGADPSEAGSQVGADRVTIPFDGEAFALRVRRGPYRGYLFVSVDGAPANLLPRDERGAYLALSSPDESAQVVTIPVAAGLVAGQHTAVVVAERGWDQWPLVGWSAGRWPNPAIYNATLAALLTLALASLLFSHISTPPLPYSHTLLPWGLALVAATAPFYLHPIPLFGKAFSAAEILTLLCALVWGIGKRQDSCILHPATFFVLAAIASCLIAEFRRVALRELRVVVLEPALFYLMLRTSRLDERGIWRVVDGFVAGAVAVAVIGLVQYGLGVNVITAEEGFRRLRSVYGSPNNAGLYMGRALPVLVAVALWGRRRARRIVYGAAILPVGAAALLSFSKGAILLGIPLSMLALGALAGGRWLRAAAGTVAAAAVAAIPLLRTPRFAALFSRAGGTTFFRIQLWRAAWMMFRDHPWLGVGLDNFLYHYRGRYILPAAWQEPHLSHPHNIALDYACRLGLWGLAALVWLQAAFWRRALPLRRLADADMRALALGMMGLMVNFLAHGLVDASYFVIDLAFVFFLTLGVVEWIGDTREGQ